jgi:hypothetical protein
MIRHIRAKSLALGMAALTICAAPVLARAQPYDQGGYATPGVGPGPGDYDQRRRDYDAQYGPGAYDRDSVDQERAREACRQQKQNNQVVGGVLGGIAGAVIGSNVARGGGREGGAIIGGVAGGVAGSQIAKGQAHCDEDRGD